MKKSMLVLLAMMVAFAGFVGCSTDDDEGIGTEGGPCRTATAVDGDDDTTADADFSACDTGLACVADFCVKVGSGVDGDVDAEVDGDADVEGEAEVVCNEDDCIGAAICNDKDVCEVLCIDTSYNEDCASVYGFTTFAYGDCEDVPCTTDDDCKDLGNCDDPSKSSTKAFTCDTDKCKRTTTK